MQTKVFSLFILMIIFLSSNAQKCKPVVEEIDKFTKVSKIIYGGQLVENIIFSDKSQTISTYFGKANDSLFLNIQLTKIIDQADMMKYEDAKEDMNLKKGSQLYFVLANGESIVLTSLYDSKLSKKKVLSSLTVTMVAAYGLTTEQLAKFASATITDIRIDFADVSPLTAKVKSGKSEKMKAQFECAKERFAK